MLKVMQEKEKSRRGRPKKDPWFLYILRCADGTFYTGITNDLERRVKTHNDGKGAHYTRTRRPVALVYQENGMTKAQALTRECAIKALPKKDKEELLKSAFPLFIKKRGRGCVF